MGGWFSSKSLDQQIIIACEKNNSDALKQILYSNERNVLDKFQLLMKARGGSEKHAPLFVACLNGSVDVVQVLLDFEHQNYSRLLPNPPCPPMIIERSYTGATALHFACEASCYDKSDVINIVRLLLDKGADITIRNRRGHNPLDVSRLVGNLPLVRYLEDRISLFTGWIHLEHSTGIQKGVGKVLGTKLKDALKTLVGGDWKRNYVSIIRIQGCTSAACPPNMQCPRCATVLTTPIDTINKIFAERPAVLPAVRCVGCGQALRIPNPIPETLCELAVYNSSTEPAPFRTYSLVGASARILNPNDVNKSGGGGGGFGNQNRAGYKKSKSVKFLQPQIPEGTNHIISVVAYSKNEQTGKMSRRSLQFACESRAAAEAILGAINGEPVKVPEITIPGVPLAQIYQSPNLDEQQQQQAKQDLPTSSSSSSSSTSTTSRRSWVCNRCTFENFASTSSQGAGLCEMCNAPEIQVQSQSNPRLAPSAPPPQEFVEATVIDEGSTSASLSGNDIYPTALAVSAPLPQNSRPSYAQSSMPEDELDAFICPITNAVMQDPVLTIDGFSYERSAITDWFNRNPGNYTSPMTGERLESNILVPNNSLRQAIQQYYQGRSGSVASASSVTNDDHHNNVSLSLS